MLFSPFRMLKSAWCIQPRTHTARGNTGMHLEVSWAGLFNEPVEIVQVTLSGSHQPIGPAIRRPRPQDRCVLHLIDTGSHSCCLKDVSNVSFLLTARWIAALVGVGPVSCVADHEMIIKVFRVASQRLRTFNSTFVSTNSFSRDCVRQLRMAFADAFLMSFSVRLVYICETCSRCLAQWLRLR